MRPCLKKINKEKIQICTFNIHFFALKRIPISFYVLEKYASTPNPNKYLFSCMCVCVRACVHIVHVCVSTHVCGYSGTRREVSCSLSPSTYSFETRSRPEPGVRIFLAKLEVTNPRSPLFPPLELGFQDIQET